MVVLMLGLIYMITDGLFSIPIWGNFIDIRYRSLQDGDHYLKHCFTGPLIGIRPVKYIGRGGVVEVAKYTRRAGIPYICKAGEIHSYVPKGNGMAISFVITGRPKREFANVWHDYA